jgi:DUF438 domain-containing protein
MIGQLPNDVLEAVLETLPIELSVLDANDQVVAWNKHDTRIFKRPTSALGLNVCNCHPHHSLHKVETILVEMRQGTRDTARFWIDLHLEGIEAPQKILIEYYALRDQEGTYLGCLEASQNITDTQAITGEQRLLD